MPVIRPEKLVAERTEAIVAYHRATRVGRAEIDVSGGVDSAVMLALLVRALGTDAVTAVFMGIHSSDASRGRAIEVARAVGARLVVDELGEAFDQRISAMLDGLVEAGYAREEIEARIAEDPTVLGSIRSCLRAPLGRGYNRLTGGGIRHGTGNECEDRFLRFYQKGGDGEVDTNPLAMLSKGEVYQLGCALGVPRSVLAAEPSPDLWGAGVEHNDEAELFAWSGGIPWRYSRVDPDSRQYTKVGSIERVSRYLDDIDDALFRQDVSVRTLIKGEGYARASDHRAFGGLDANTIEMLLRSAHQIEASTRHKHNPNIPELGTRQQLLDEGILTNELPAEPPLVARQPVELEGG